MGVQLGGVPGCMYIWSWKFQPTLTKDLNIRNVNCIQCYHHVSNLKLNTSDICGDYKTALFTTSRNQMRAYLSNKFCSSLQMELHNGALNQNSSPIFISVNVGTFVGAEQKFVAQLHLVSRCMVKKNSYKVLFWPLGERYLQCIKVIENRV